MLVKKMENIEDIYMDESGSTGQDLLNADQPVFVLASNNFTKDECNVLPSLFKSNKELHFKILKNSEEGREAIINFINHPLISEKNIVCSVSHKNYCTVGHLIDRIVEPILFNKGIDLYQFGGNIIATNILYTLGNFHWDKVLFNLFLLPFVQMVREKSPESIENFYKYVFQLYNSVEEKTILQPLIESTRQIELILEGINKYSIDLTLSAFYVLSDIWHKKTSNKLNIIQDDSKQINYFIYYINFTKNLDLEYQEVGFGSRKMIFPSQINKIDLVNSTNYLGVQISDIIASSIAFLYSNKNLKQNYFVEQIKTSKLLNLINFHTI